MLNRRRILGAGLGSVALAAGRRVCAAKTPRKTLLVLGGTGFIGPHLTALALARGWTVTHFNRGKRDADGVAGVESLVGDRNGQLDALRGRRWDAVVDNTGFVPRHVQASATLLAPNVGYCVFVSSISAYASFAKPNRESSPTGQLGDVNTDKVTNESYGPMKALCEQYSLQAFAGRVSIVRPGYIVGPLDGSDRITYWPVRAARGGEMLAPGTPGDPVQIIDVRDLAAWMILLVERRTLGYFNAVSAPRQFTIGAVVAASQRAAGSDAARATWVPEAFLSKHWKPEELDIPPWAPLSGESAGAALSTTARARAAGLRIRPLQETVRDTLQWFRTLPAERQATLRAGIDPQRERDALQAWREAPRRS